MTNRRLLKLVLAAFLLFPSAVFGATFDTIVVFGDSLSDNGNVYELTSYTEPAPETYYQGRYSNGPVWVEYLAGASYMNCTLEDEAYAGAESGDGALPSASPGLLTQVDSYVDANTLPTNALFVIWIGANDLLRLNLSPAGIVDNIETALETLASFGAESIMVCNLPNLGTTPGLIDTSSSEAATATAQLFNSTLADMIDYFSPNYPGVSIYELDVYSIFEEVCANPGIYGFTNVTEESPNFAMDNNFDNSAGYLFWDDKHPTTEGHEQLAEQAYDLLNPAADDDDDDDNTIECFIGSLFH